MEELLDEINTDEKKTLLFRPEIAFIWFSIFAIGYLFKVMHWPFTGLLRIIGAGGFMAYAFSLWILTKQKTILLLICNTLSLFWIVIILWGFFFNDGYPFNYAGLTLQGITFGILLVLHFALLLIIKKRRSR
ncbi:hypothetical protein [Fluviicola sp.]|uniref:hypothetical protein n=1 Tax=Fluviicola sp. TaxID=1917219 RepID=UPI00263775D7|nr:hypothetical protein [Fluviicola sp.]